MMKKQKERPRYNIFQNILFLLKDIRQEHPILILFILTEIVLSVISPVFGIYIPKAALDLVLERAHPEQVFFTLGTFGLIMTLSMALSGMTGQGKYMLYNDMRRYYQTKLFLQSLSCDYKNVESMEGQTRYQKAMGTLRGGDFSGTSVLLVAAIDMAVSVLCFVIYSGIMSSLSPVMILVLVALSLISLFATRRAQGYEHSRRDEAAEYEKKLEYVIREATLSLERTCACIMRADGLRDFGRV